MVDKNKMIFIGVGSLLAIIFVFFMASFVMPRILVTSSKAAGLAKVSIKNSLIMGEKIMAKADGVEECVVNVFVVDADGKGIKGKQVQLSGLGEQTVLTNDLGKATFKLKTIEAKQYELTANINGAALGKTLKVTFK